MATRQVFQTASLLAMVQGLLGLVGYNTPWWGLAATAAFGWFIWRVARVVRGQLNDLRRRGRPVAPLTTALWIAVLWQIPAYATMPLWATPRFAQVWQGALMPLVRLLDMAVPAAAGAGAAWLWLAVLAEAAVFVWLVGRVPAPVFTLDSRKAPTTAPAPGAEWAPIRRFEEAFLARDAAGRREPKE